MPRSPPAAPQPAEAQRAQTPAEHARRLLCPFAYITYVHGADGKSAAARRRGAGARFVVYTYSSYNARMASESDVYSALPPGSPYSLVARPRCRQS